MKDFMEVSPLKILEKSPQGELGRGNLGVLMARAGDGKTACLIHIAFDKLFRNEKLVHVSLEDGPEKVASYYQVIFSDLAKALQVEDEYESRMLLDKNRMILAYLNRSFQIQRLKENLTNLVEKLNFVPNALIVDGLDFAGAGREVFEGFKGVATQFDIEIWFSALTHRHIIDANERGIPYPCNQFDDLFDIIIHLQPSQAGIFLKLLKDHEGSVVPDAHVRLDPNTFSPMA